MFAWLIFLRFFESSALSWNFDPWKVKNWLKNSYPYAKLRNFNSLKFKCPRFWSRMTKFLTSQNNWLYSIRNVQSMQVKFMKGDEECNVCIYICMKNHYKINIKIIKVLKNINNLLIDQRFSILSQYKYTWNGK